MRPDVRPSEHSPPVLLPEMLGRSSTGDGTPGEPVPDRRKVERPSYEQLMADVASMSFLAIGRKYGVSDKAVRKWIRWYEYQREMEEWREQEDPN